MGRFLSVDPMFEAYPGLTPYHYCANSPLTNVDPSGMTMESFVFDDCVVEENIEGVVKQGIDPLDPEPDPEEEKPRSGGGSGGGNAIAYTQSTGITETASAPEVGGKGGKAGGGGMGSTYSINSLSLVEWSKKMATTISRGNTMSELIGSLSSGMVWYGNNGDRGSMSVLLYQGIIEDALDIISNNGGKAVVDYIRSMNIPITFIPGNEIYKIYIKNKPSYSNEFLFLQGLTVHYRAPITGSYPPSWNTIEPYPIIYIAMEVLEGDKKSPIYSDYSGWTILFDDRKYMSEVWFVLAHEIWHAFANSSPFSSFLNNETFSYTFQKYIFDSYYFKQGFTLDIK